MTRHLNPRLQSCALIYFCRKKNPITFLPTFGSLNSAVLSPESWLFDKSMHAWLGPAGGKNGEFEPLFCRRRRGREGKGRGTFSGLIAISLIFFLLFSPSLSPLLASFLLQAPAPSNRTERYEVPVRGRPHPSQLGGVAFDRGQSDHQRFQYDRESWYWDVHPVRHIQRLGVRCMIRRERKKTHKNKQKEKYLQGKWTWEEEKKTYEISRMKKGPIDINIKIKRDKSTSFFFFFLLKSAFKGPTLPLLFIPPHHHQHHQHHYYY